MVNTRRIVTKIMHVSQSKIFRKAKESEAFIVSPRIASKNTTTMLDSSVITLQFGVIEESRVYCPQTESRDQSAT